ncbi:TIGR00730 family Rossman fold protein [Candidatus Woesearchaeota archaeon]|nr:MAG: TIGR00730 family Rossman fold protein [Candidatus Woesearchaeota archaeon]
MGRLRKNRKYYFNKEKVIRKVEKELDSGLTLLNSINRKIVTFFGSHQVKKSSPYYKHCEQTAYELGKRGYAVLSGGGPGIMQAANSGAKRAGTVSVGLKAGLIKNERVSNSVFTKKLSFEFVFVRRFILSIKSEALIFYPGGLGTLNELFEYVVLMQTGITDRVPIICVNRDYWKGLFEWLEQMTFKQNFFINDINDLKLLLFADNLDEIIKIIEGK